MRPSLPLKEVFYLFPNLKLSADSMRIFQGILKRGTHRYFIDFHIIIFQFCGGAYGNIRCFVKYFSETKERG